MPASDRSPLSALATLAGRVVGPVPPPLLQTPLSVMMRLMTSRHRDVFDRMADYADAVFIIDPIDLPVCLAMQLDARAPVLRVATEQDTAGAAARIQGPVAQLIALLEGRIDGDALFFSRQLVVEGDTEAIVALRNAVDGEDIDLRAELVRAAGPFSAIAAALLNHLERTYARADAALTAVHDTLLAPARRELDRQRQDIEDLRSQMTQSAAKQRTRARAGFVS
jgi:predicted lipid carrier protein YhbT